MAAICYLKFSVGCIYLVCLFLVQPASPFDDESYYRYDCLDCPSSVRHAVEIDNGGFIRHRRQAVPSHPNDTDTTSHGPSGTDAHHNASLPTTHPDDGGAGNKLTRVQLQSAADGGFIHHHVLDGSTTPNATDPSATNVLADSHPPQIIAADFDPNTKAVSNLSDLVKEDKDTDITINQFLEDREITPDTLKQFNATKYLKLINDTHIYYNSSFIVDEKIGEQYWVDMTSDKVNVHDMLSQSHRRAATVQLSFNFPFYGHLVNNVTIATGGFLFTGDHIHIWLAATQYIAPLMANFDTRISNGSYVKYLDNGTAFTVLWENVILKDSPELGNFTFEATLHENGDIVFVYKNIPVMIEHIKDVNHPVKVGISDAYIIDRTIFFVKRKTIYEYHRVNFSKEDIRNWTVIYLQALPTCRDMKDCDSCIHADNVNLECKWCPSVDRCSTGLDRARQEWLAHECDKLSVKQCNEPPPPPHAHKAAEPAMAHAKQSDGSHSEKSRTVVGTSGVISLLLVITSLAAIAFLFLYAYRNPHSTPGQILIRYRPSQWSWRRGEARYTAATIHM